MKSYKTGNIQFDNACFWMCSIVSKKSTHFLEVSKKIKEITNVRILCSTFSSINIMIFKKILEHNTLRS